MAYFESIGHTAVGSWHELAAALYIKLPQNMFRRRHGDPDGRNASLHARVLSCRIDGLEVLLQQTSSCAVTTIVCHHPDPAAEVVLQSQRVA